MAIRMINRAGWVILLMVLALVLAVACQPGVKRISTITKTDMPTGNTETPSQVPMLTNTPAPISTETKMATTTPTPLVPVLDHVVIFMFQNKEFTSVIKNTQMPVFNQFADEYTLLEGYYAVTHPSLPNYIALIAGDTFGIETDYPNVVLNAPILPDSIEASGRTWKAYMESMPEACGLQDTLSYVQKHNPFVFFKSIRENLSRCREHIVPLEELGRDIQQGTLPNYVFISPNLCHSGHETTTRPDDCGYRDVDHWMAGWLDQLVYYPGLMDKGVIVLDWDEGQGNHTCCGFESGGGRVATVLISNRVEQGFVDPNPYTHYSLVRTIAESWSMPAPGNATDNEKAPLIIAPWH
jgi:hypothetical protein